MLTHLYENINTTAPANLVWKKTWSTKIYAELNQ